MTLPIVIVSGSRKWTDGDAIRGVLELYIESHGRFELVHGACRGADRLAETAARRLGIPYRAFPADWRGAGRHDAGKIRNKLMLAEGPSHVLAFKDGFDWSLEVGGTEHMVDIALRAGVPTWVASHEATGLVLRRAQEVRPSLF